MNNDYEFIKGQMILKLNGIPTLTSALPLTRESLYTLDGSIRTIPELSSPIEPIPIKEVKEATNQVIELVTIGSPANRKPVELADEAFQSVEKATREAKEEASKKVDAYKAVDKLRSEIDEDIAKVQTLIDSKILDDTTKIIPTVNEAFDTIISKLSAAVPTVPSAPTISSSVGIAKSAFENAVDVDVLKTGFETIKSTLDAQDVSSETTLQAAKTSFVEAYDAVYPTSATTSIKDVTNLLSKAYVYIKALESYTPPSTPSLPKAATDFAKEITKDLMTAVEPIQKARNDAKAAMEKCLQDVKTEAEKLKHEQDAAGTIADEAETRYNSVEAAKNAIYTETSGLDKITKDAPYDEVDKEIGDRVDTLKRLIRFCEKAKIEEKEVQPIYDKIAQIEYQRTMMAFGPAIRSYFEGFLEFLKNRLDAGDKTVKEAKTWDILVLEYIDKYVKKFKFGSKTELVLLLDITLAENLVYNNLENSLNIMSMLETKFKATIGAKPEDEEAFANYKNVLKSLVEYMKADQEKSQFKGRQPGESYTAYTDRRRKFIRDFVDKIYAQEGDRITPGTPMGKPVKGMIDSQYEAAANILKGIFEERMTIAEETAKNPTAKAQLMSTLDNVRTREQQKKRALETVQQRLTGMPVPLDTPAAGWSKIIGAVNAEIAARGVENMVLDSNVQRGGAVPAPIAIQPLQKFIDDLLNNAPVEKLLSSPAVLNNFLDKPETKESFQKTILESLEKYDINSDKAVTDAIETKIKGIDLSKYSDIIAKTVNGDSKTKQAIANILKNKMQDEIFGEISKEIGAKTPAMIESTKQDIVKDPTFLATILSSVTLKPEDHDKIAKGIISNPDTTTRDLIVEKAAGIFMADPRVEIDNLIKEAVNLKLDPKTTLEALKEKIDPNITPDLMTKAINAIYNPDNTSPNAFAEAIFTKFAPDKEKYDAFKADLVAKIAELGIIKNVVQDIVKDAFDISDLSTEVDKAKVLEKITSYILSTEAVQNFLSKEKEELTSELSGLKQAVTQGLGEIRSNVEQFVKYKRQLDEANAALQEKQAQLERKIKGLTEKAGTVNAAEIESLTRKLESLQAQYNDNNQAYLEKLGELEATFATKTELQELTRTIKSGSNENLAILVKGMLGMTGTKAMRDAAEQAILKAWPEILSAHSVPVNIDEEFAGGADAAGPSSGGPDLAPLPKDNAKKQLATLDQVKKEVRGVRDALATIKGTYEQTYRKLFKPDKNSEQTQEGGTSTTGREAIKVAISPEDQQTLGKWKTLQEDGQKWVKEVEDTIKAKKASIENVLKLLQSIFETEPANKKFMDYGVKVKLLFEGNYQATDEDEKKGLLTMIQSISQEVKTQYENIARVLKPKALAVEQKIQLEKERLQAEGRRRGGAVWMVGGGDTLEENIDKIDKKLQNVVMNEIVKDLDSIYMRQANPVMASAASEPSIFAGLYNDYLDRRNSVGSFVASRELSQQLHNNALIPREVLAVTKLDKTIFVFVTLFIRLFALTIAEYMIERGVIKTMASSLAVFVGLYLVIFVLFVILVNMDIYRMRIVFNYVNFHANSGLVYSHVGMLILFTIVIYIIMRNVNFPIQGIEITAITEEEKSNLIYRLEILTMIVWLFLVILIAVM